MLSLTYYLLLILELLLTYSNAEPIKGDNVVTAEEGEFAFVASLIRSTGDQNAERDHFCTGVLISKNHVLTAKHCIEGQFLHKIQIVLGSVDLRNGTRYNVISGINYDRWAKSKGILQKPQVNDIAIVKLTEEVDENVAQPAKLSSRKKFNLFKNENATVVGWGQTNLPSDIRSSRYLQKAPLTVLTATQCQDTISRLLNLVILIQDNMFCTKIQPFTLIGCGDSGGPLLNQKNKVIGINMATCPKYSALTSDQNNNRVNLHADVNFYKTFIMDVLENY